jgi:hypothetical protein
MLWQAAAEAQGPLEAAAAVKRGEMKRDEEGVAHRSEVAAMPHISPTTTSLAHGGPWVS